MPEIFFNELNIANTNQNVIDKSILDNVFAGIILNSDFGECLIASEISDVSELNKKFYTVNNSDNIQYNIVLDFLKYSDKLKIIRPIDTTTIANKRMNFLGNNIPSKTQINGFYNSVISETNLPLVNVGTNKFSFIEKYPNANEDIAILICTDLTHFNKEISDEKVYIILSKTITTPPINNKNNDMYIVPVGATGDWVGYDGFYAIWQNSNNSWNFVSAFPNDSIYVIDEQKEYYYNSGWIARDSNYSNIDYYKYKNEYGYRLIYNTLQDSVGKPFLFNKLFLTIPDFNNNEFCVLVLKRNVINNKFDLIEKYLTSESTCESDINFKSNCIYIKLNNVLLDKPNNNNYSVLESVFRHDSATLPVYNSNALNAALNLLKNDNNILVTTDFEFNNEMNIVNNVLHGTNKTIISGTYNNTRYNSVQNIIDDFSIYRTNNYYNSIKNNNNLIMVNFKLNSNNKYIPVIGEVAGKLLSYNNLKNKQLAGFVYGRLNNIKNTKFKFNSIEIKQLHSNLINAVNYDNIQKVFYISNDLINNNNTKMNVMYNMVFDLIEQTVTTYYNNYNLKNFSKIALETLKQKLSELINQYNITNNIEYVINNNNVLYKIYLNYKNNIKEIIVNIIY